MTFMEFNDWWVSGESLPDNPFEEDSPRLLGMGGLLRCG